jgi:phage shock protein C
VLHLAILFLDPLWQNRIFPEASMFCPQCGKQVDPNARFCAACGATVTAAAPPPFAGGIPTQRTAHLTRSRENRMIAGICAGYALYYGWDLNLVRILTFLLILFTGIGAIVYLAAWVIIPEAPYALPAKST